MKKILLVAVAVAMAAGAGAQTKAELKMYDKTVAKPSVKAYEKFLQKYPSSPLAGQIELGRDSMVFQSIDLADERALEAFLSKYKSETYVKKAQEQLNNLRTSNLTAEEIKAALKANAPEGASVAGAALRKYGVDYVIGAAIAPGSGQIETMLLKSDGGLWSKEKSSTHEINTMMTPAASAMVEGASLCRINSSDSDYLKFAYLSKDGSGSKAEYVVNLLDWKNDILHSAIFYGNNLLKAGADGYRIEGQSPAMIGGGMMSPEQLYLGGVMAENPNLVKIADEDAWTDEAIQWWLEKNPKAQTTASSLSFGILKEGCGIVKKFLGQSKETSSGYSAALFDIRGYTVICAKHAGEYVLVWCEPVAKNKKKDSLLNSIYFEKGSTLCLFYYKGKSTFKYRVNLAGKSIKR